MKTLRHGARERYSSALARVAGDIGLIIQSANATSMSGLLVGSLLPPSGSIVTETSAVVRASAERTTSAAPRASGRNVGDGIVFVEPFAMVHAWMPRRAHRVGTS